MIQILGLREYWNRSKQKYELTHAFYKEGWRAESLQKILESPQSILETIPESEHFNLYFTVCHTHDKKARDFSHQFYIPFDIDDVGEQRKEEAFEAFCEALNLSHDKTGCIFSGGGIQTFIELDSPIESKDYFDEVRGFYKTIARRVDAELRKRNLPGKTDTSVWSANRLMRMPETYNIKEKEGLKKKAYVIQEHLEPQPFDFHEKSGIPYVERKEQVSTKALEGLPPVDDKEVQRGCEFLKHCYQNQASVSEPEWYAMLSVVGRIPGGRNLAHEYSKYHPDYTEEETEEKLNQALMASGPRTCENIESLWGGCDKCAWKGHVTSPIMIQGEDFIKTRESGFYEIYYDSKGNAKYKPNYEDLIKYFREVFGDHVVENETGRVFVFNGKYWEIVYDLEIKAFAERNFNPRPNMNQRREFIEKLKLKNIIKNVNDFFHGTTRKKINMQNGVFDISTMKLVDHSKDYGFTNILPYSYDPKALEAPIFNQFMDEITCGREDLKKVLLEFCGYAISGDDYWLHKALVLSGSGSNGKSTFMQILKEVAGEENCSKKTMSELNKETARYELENKLFNIGEETKVRALAESEVFKTLTSGNEITVKKLYQQEYEITNRAKIIFACNEDPRFEDTSHGFFRRLVIVPFERQFSEEEADKAIHSKLRQEKTAIFNIFIRHYKDLLERGGLPKSETVDNSLEKYKTENDIFYLWLGDCLSQGNGEDFASNDDLWDSFSQYCERRNALRFKIYTDFIKRLGRELPQYFDCYKTRKQIGSVRKRGFLGVRLEGGGEIY